MPRKNKSKKEIVSEIQLVADATRRRSLVKDIVFPHLVEMDETIGYCNTFVQAMSALINGEFDSTRKTTTVGHLRDVLVDKLGTIFNVKDEVQRKEYDRYLGLIEKLEHISIQDFTYAAELPRFIDGYLTKNKYKDPISEVEIDKILG